MSGTQPAEGYTVRAARASDIPALAAIETASFTDPWPASAFAEVLAMPGAVCRVLPGANDEALAYCVLLTAADQGEIASLAVAAGYRRQGLASALLGDVLRVARSLALEAVFLEVRASNRAAQALYLAHDFREIGRRKGYYQRPAEDALVLKWSGGGGGETVL